MGPIVWICSLRYWRFCFSWASCIGLIKRMGANCDVFTFMVSLFSKNKKIILYRPGFPMFNEAKMLRLVDYN